MFLNKKKEEQKIKKLEQEILIARDDLNEISSYLDDFLAFLPLAICHITPSLVLGNINNAFQEISGFDAIEASGRKFSTFFLEKPTIEKILSLAQRGPIKDQELILVKKDGTNLPVSVSIAAQKDIQGKIIGYLAGIINISDIKNAQKNTEETIIQRTKQLEQSGRALLNILEDTEEARSRAEEEKNKTQTIFENFIDGLLMFNQGGFLERINPEAERFLEIKKQEVIGKNIQELKKINKIVPLINILKDGKKEVFREELDMEKKEVVLEVTSKTIVSREGGVATFVILHDISREKIIERMKSQFVSVAAHQLRTPLSIIKWSLSMVLEGEAGLLTKEQNEMLSKASKTNERMIRLINDLLNVARIEEGRFIYRPTVVDLSELIEQTIEPVYQSAKNKAVKLEFKKSTTKTTITKGDIEKLSLAIKNIVENAVFYTKAKGSVKVFLSRKDEKLLISIKDTGIGIPKNQHNRVFGKFFRADNAVRQETEGTGLGLFIAKNVIEAHGGEIWFESEPEKGTTFFINLPAIG